LPWLVGLGSGMGVDYRRGDAADGSHPGPDHRGRGVRAAGCALVLGEREQVRKTRTASQERAAIFWAVVAGVAVQSLELIVVILLLKAILGAL
jgi:hypothetical protein